MRALRTQARVLGGGGAAVPARQPQLLPTPAVRWAATTTTTTTTPTPTLKKKDATSEAVARAAARAAPPIKPRLSRTGLDLPRETFSPEQVKELETFAFKLIKDKPESTKRVKMWLREKLGPAYSEDWSLRTGQRLRSLAEQEERAKRMPPPSAVFAVEHAVAPTPTPTPSTAPTSPQKEAQRLARAAALSHFAVIPLQGSQHKVVVGDRVVVDRVDVPVSGQLVVKEVLMLGSPGRTVVGRPHVPNATVTLTVEQQVKEEKVLTLHKREKKNSQRMRGSRRQVTVLRVAELQTETGEVVRDPVSRAAKQPLVGVDVVPLPAPPPRPKRDSHAREVEARKHRLYPFFGKGKKTLSQGTHNRHEMRHWTAPTVKRAKAVAKIAELRKDPEYMAKRAAAEATKKKSKADGAAAKEQAKKKRDAKEDDTVPIIDTTTSSSSSSSS